MSPVTCTHGYPCHPWCALMNIPVTRDVTQYYSCHLWRDTWIYLSTVTCAHEYSCHPRRGHKYSVTRDVRSWIFSHPSHVLMNIHVTVTCSWIFMSPVTCLMNIYVTVTYSWIFKLPCRVTMNIHITRDISYCEYSLSYCHITRHVYTESRPMAFQVKSAHRFNNRKYFYWLISRLTVWLGIFNCSHCFCKHGLLVWVRQKYWIFRFYEENRPTVRTKHKHDPKWDTFWTICQKFFDFVLISWYYLKCINFRMETSRHGIKDKTRFDR